MIAFHSFAIPTTTINRNIGYPRFPQGRAHKINQVVMEDAQDACGGSTTGWAEGDIKGHRASWRSSWEAQDFGRQLGEPQRRQRLPLRVRLWPISLGTRMRQPAHSPIQSSMGGGFRWMLVRTRGCDEFCRSSLDQRTAHHPEINVFWDRV